MATLTAEGFPPLKDLASSDHKLRRIATENLLTYMTSPTRTAPLTHTQCLQAWRALFVALMMHDSKNQLSVQRLVASLAKSFKLVAQRDDDVSEERKQREDRDGAVEDELTTFSTAFWETISREWSGVDQFRVDKVLLLVRMVIRQVFELCLAASENRELDSRTKSQVGIFEAGPLSPRERKVPDGLRYHVLDVWVDELERCFQTAGQGDVEFEHGDAMDRVKMLMGAVERISKEGLSKTVRTRAKDVLSDAGQRLGVGG